MQIRRCALGDRLFCAGGGGGNGASVAAGDDLYTVQAYSGLGTLFDYQAVSTFPAGWSQTLVWYPLMSTAPGCP